MDKGVDRHAGENIVCKIDLASCFLEELGLALKIIFNDARETFLANHRI